MRLLFNQHDRWYAVEATGADSVYSARLCCYCARAVRADLGKSTGSESAVPTLTPVQP